MKALLHVDLIVRDVDRALAFWVGAFGCTVVGDIQVDDPGLLDFETQGAAEAMRILFLKPPAPRQLIVPMIELIHFRYQAGRERAHDGHSSLHSISFLVDDLDRRVAELAQRGVQPVSKIFTVPMEGKISRIVFFRDPDANLVELVHTREATSTSA